MTEEKEQHKKIFWTNKWDKLWLLIIPAGLLFDALTRPNRYNYFWFWVIVICVTGFIGYILYHMFNPKFAWVDPTTTAGKKVKAEVDEQTFGVFVYTDDGFDFIVKGTIQSFRWAEIKSIFVYKRDLMTVDQLNLEALTTNNTKLHVTEDSSGWFEFIERIKQVFPTIDKEFEIALMFPAFETNLMLIYDQEGRKLEEAIKDYR